MNSKILTLLTRTPLHVGAGANAIRRIIPVTGWALPGSEDDAGGKSTHLAVPAGSVYYFKAVIDEHAGKLATVPNWHGAPDGEPTSIANRRSTLCGEKGFVPGFCSPWQTY